MEFVQYLKALENNNPMFKFLSSSEKDIICQKSTVYEYDKEEYIYKEGFLPSGLLILVEGKVKIFKDIPTGREQILRLCNSGDFIGYRALFANENYNLSSKAIDKSIVCNIPKDVIFKLVRENSYLAMFFINFFAKELSFTENKLVSLTQKHIRGRLAESILRLIDTYGYEADNKTIKVRIYREDLANLACMTTSNAIKTLYSFKEEGVIDIEGKKIIILNLKKLQEISQMG